MKNKYEIKIRNSRAPETLLRFNGTEWQAQRVARALSCVYTETGAQSLELFVVPAAGERCVTRWTYKGVARV